MKALIVACTYYQLLVGINLKHTILKNDDVDLFFAEGSQGCEEVLERLESTTIFNHVSLFHHDIDTTTFTKKVAFMWDLSIRQYKKNHKMPFGFPDHLSYDYDKIFFYNNKESIQYLIKIVAQNSPHLELIRFEEGYVSYLIQAPSQEKVSDYTKVKKILLNKKNKKKRLRLFLKLIRAKVLKSEIITQKLISYYFFDKELVINEFIRSKTIEIPKLDYTNIKLKETIQTIFPLDLENINLKKSFAQKYIFFEQCFDKAGLKVPDYDLVEKIASCVGKDNLMIKLHPASLTDRFTDNGYHICPNTDIPWEAVMVHFDFSDYVFITVHSGSVISPKLMFSQNVKTYFLMECFPTSLNKNQKKLIHYFRKFGEYFDQQYDTSNFSFPKTTKLFLEELEDFVGVHVPTGGTYNPRYKNKVIMEQLLIQFMNLLAKDKELELLARQYLLTPLNLERLKQECIGYENLKYEMPLIALNSNEFTDE